LKTKHVNLKQRLYALSLREGALSEAEKVEESKVAAVSVHVGEVVKRLCQLAFVCMLRDGGYETAAVSVPSAMLEVRLRVVVSAVVSVRFLCVCE
jgi:hypothetical protein